MTKTTSSKSEDLHVYERGKHNDPLNAEPKLDILTSHYITPVSALFHRNHDDVVYEPQIKQVYTDWNVSLRVDRDVSQEEKWSQWVSNDAKMIPAMDLVQAENTCKGLVHLDTTATIECAGNRRETLSESEVGKAEGIQWGPGVIANVSWSGASIRSLLLLNDIPDPYSHHADLTALTPSDLAITSDCAQWAQALHLQLLSAQPTSESERPGGEFFGASIPLSTAMHPNQKCILAHQHNGKILEQAHGFPIRAVIPGHAGARWVKWLNGLRISKHENESPPMQLDYKIMSPPKDADKEEVKEWKEKMMGDNKDVAFRRDQLSQKEAMQRLGMGSAIDSPHEDTIIEGSDINAKGYAVGQDGSPVSSVECIILAQEDASESHSSLRDRAEMMSASDWTRAEVQNNSNEDGEKGVSWAWTLWEVQVPLPKSNKGRNAIYALVARASELWWKVERGEMLANRQTKASISLSRLDSNGVWDSTRKGVTLERKGLSNSFLASHSRSQNEMN